MANRRDFLYKSILGTAGMVTAPSIINAANSTETAIPSAKIKNNFLRDKFKPEWKFGMGGVAAGNGFHVNSDEDIRGAMDAAWNNGVRYFDTSPWYGLGISERRMGSYLFNKNREDFVLSTKVGRVLTPDPDFELPGALWKGKLNMNYEYDYSAEGTRKSVEQSLHRLGLAYIDIVFIHDLSPDNPDFKEGDYEKYFDQAQNGAMPELTKMREKGLIKGWGLGVNTTRPILETIEVADPDIFLSAKQYSLLVHEDDLNNVFPVCEKEGISLVIGAALNAGFLAGKERYNYGGTIPEEMKEKRAKLQKVADKHNVDLRTAALQFSAAPDVVASVIPGASNGEQSEANAKSMDVKIPKAFWKELKSKGLIAENAPEPK
ncbi:D-threo-aldose 1-dehydrogenase [Zunongwangia mangrovi]|uniref:D-threo-aldose 1-dehydrogenase n=1 Tax=Zunongwangia mangrovi TaxID=1334022 RepID=A0A1I1M681_9FLAO|nr:aldo/keto reductase [Zunongwangia mangrovi]SFC80725.1 D-threo-aldose 1-dehydrogenase [Zunongwangia mangrovi]